MKNTLEQNVFNFLLLWWRYFMWTPSNQILKYLNVGNAPSAILFLLCFFILTPEDSDWKTLTLVLTVNSLSRSQKYWNFPPPEICLGIWIFLEAVLIGQWSLGLTLTILRSTYWWPLEPDLIQPAGLLDVWSMQSRTAWDVLCLTGLQTLSPQNSQSQWGKAKGEHSTRALWLSLEIGI